MLNVKKLYSLLILQIKSSLFLLFLLSFNSQATLITVDENIYDASIYTGTFEIQSDLLKSQIWYGNESLADEFSVALFTALSPSPGQAFATAKFAFTTLKISGGDYVNAAYARSQCKNNCKPRSQNLLLPIRNETDYVTATWVRTATVPEPASILLFCLALLGLSLFRRKEFSNEKASSI